MVDLFVGEADFDCPLLQYRNAEYNLSNKTDGVDYFWYFIRNKKSFILNILIYG